VINDGFLFIYLFILFFYISDRSWLNMTNNEIINDDMTKFLSFNLIIMVKIWKKSIQYQCIYSLDFSFQYKIIFLQPGEWWPLGCPNLTPSHLYHFLKYHPMINGSREAKKFLLLWYCLNIFVSQIINLHNCPSSLKSFHILKKDICLNCQYHLGM
jgi:hypothetical protein